MPDKANSTKPRVIRVFISSTFKDMKEERDVLVKFIFPQLRKMCEERQVVWGEVDLRWGIPDEEKAEGNVLSICLNEIKNCRPYFIGILGERYGWIEDKFNENLIQQERWLNQYAGRSVTELEILHGVLNNPDMAEHALFYFRDKQHIDGMPDNKKADFLELEEEKRKKLERLKDKIRKSGFPVHENYEDPEKLGQLVLQDLTKVIDKNFPKEEIPDALDREAIEHEAFAKSRHRVYIGRKEYFERLDRHIKENSQPLVILGESGSGKSALLSNWALEYKEKHPEDFMILHFISSSAISTDWTAMVRRIMEEFKRKFDIQGDIPDKPEELRSAFANWLYMASAKGKVIIILDALNQLEDRDQALDLVWLPPVIPENIRLFLSTLPGKPLAEIQKRNWQTLNIKPFTENEQKEYIEKYLKQYTKQLEKDIIEKIVKHKQTAIPLYLQALLEELRLYGDYFTLKNKTENYLEAETITELYQKILERYEEVYEKDRKNLVKDAFSLIWAARRGLSETELMELLNSVNYPLPRAYWSPLYLAAEQSLIARSGLLNFSHAYFRQAVQEKYLPGEEKQKNAHLCLAEYFNKPEITPRKIDELPWQFSEVKKWKQLYNLLSDLPFFEAGWKNNEYEIKTYWAAIEGNTNLRKTKGYKPVINNPSAYNCSVVWDITTILYQTGYPEEAFSLIEYIIAHYKRIGDKTNYQASLGSQAVILYGWGKLEEAMKLRQESERICRELGNKDGIQQSLLGQANIFYSWGKLEEAMKLYKESERICRELGNKDGIQQSLLGQANIFYSWGKLEEAMKLYKESERICREMGNKDGIQASLANQALILKAWSNIDGAMKLHKELERICRELGNKKGLSISLGNQALILSDWGKLEEAMKLHQEQERICRELGNKDSLSASLGNQANIFYSWGKLKEAMKLHQEQERICREMGNKDGIQHSLGNQANIFYSWGKLEEAMKLHKEEERICWELGNKNGMQRSLGNQAVILYDRGDLDGAMKLHKEKERICRELGNKDGIQRSLGHQALILSDWGKLEEAMKFHQEQERICRELGYKDSLSKTLGNQANILYTRGNLDGAMKLHKESERICRELENKNGIQTSLLGQANIFYSWGNLEEAMKLHKESERICRELENKNGIQTSLLGQANIFYSWGKLEEAMKLYKESGRICRELGNKNGIQTSLGNQAVILADWGKLEEAMKLHQEKERICRELGNKNGIQTSLGNQAVILADWGKLEEAMKLHKEQEQICRELGNKNGLSRSLINQALIYNEQMNKGKAIELANEAYDTAKKYGYTALAKQIEPKLNFILRK